MEREPYTEEDSTERSKIQGDRVTAIEKSTQPDGSEVIPNGGLKSWLQVVGTFFVFFNTWGVLNTFGAYQTYYETQELFSASSSSISWIGSLQSSLLLVLGLVTGPMYDGGYFRVLLYSGSVLLLIGQMMTSICHQYYQVLLAQGICIGIGVGLIFIPSVALLSTYFTSKLALANGLAAAGSGLGGILYPIMFHKLNDQIGFGWTVRTIGLVMFTTLLIPIALFRVRVAPSKKRKLLDVTALRVPAYLTFVFGGLITFISLNIPFFYIQYFAISTGLSDDEVGFYLLSVITTGSVIGRVLPNFLANGINPFYIVSICTVICGGLMFALIDLSNFGGIVAIALLYGFFSGAFISLTPTCFVSLSPDRSLIGTRMGMGYAIMTIGNLVGTPAAGAIMQTSGFNTMWIFGGVMSAVGGCMMMTSRAFQVRESISPRTL